MRIVSRTYHENGILWNLFLYYILFSVYNFLLDTYLLHEKHWIFMLGLCEINIISNLHINFVYYHFVTEVVGQDILHFLLLSCRSISFSHCMIHLYWTSLKQTFISSRFMFSSILGMWGDLKGKADVFLFNFVCALIGSRINSWS